MVEKIVVWRRERYCSNLGWTLTSTHYGGHEHVVHNSVSQSKVDTAVVEINLNTIIVKLQFNGNWAYLIISTGPIHLLKTYLRITSESNVEE